MDAGSGEALSIDVNASLQIKACGEVPAAWNGVVSNPGGIKQVAVEGVEPLAELASGPGEGVDQHGFDEAGFVDRADGRIVGAGGPLDHPVEDFPLAALCNPAGGSAGGQIVNETLLGGAGAGGG